MDKLWSAPFAEFNSHHCNANHLRQDEGTKGTQQTNSQLQRLQDDEIENVTEQMISNDQRNTETIRLKLNQRINMYHCMSTLVFLGCLVPTRRCLKYTADDMEPLFRCNRPGVELSLNGRGFQWRSMAFNGHGDHGNGPFSTKKTSRQQSQAKCS